MCKYYWLYIIPEVKLVLPKYIFLMLNPAAGGDWRIVLYVFPFSLTCLPVLDLPQERVWAGAESCPYNNSTS